MTGTWTEENWRQLTTLDVDPGCKPDVVHDLNVLPYPFADDTFEEIHAYEVLEHCGRQGDVEFFFGQFHEFWRILRPGGFLVGTVPLWESPWAWGDPGHTRVIPRQALIYLDRREYGQIGKTSMSDYRRYWKGNFEGFAYTEKGDTLGFILRAVK